MNENFEFVEYIYFATKFGNDKFSGILSSNKSYFKKIKERLHLKSEPNVNTNEAKPYAALQSEAKGTKAIRKILS